MTTIRVKRCGGAGFVGSERYNTAGDIGLLMGTYADDEGLVPSSVKFYELTREQVDRLEDAGQGEDAAAAVASIEAEVLSAKDKPALRSTTKLNRNMWLLAVGEPKQGERRWFAVAAGPGRGAASSSDAAAILGTLRNMELRQRRMELERLFIQPIAIPPASSGSSRSPRPDEVPDFKEATIEFYWLWASQEPDKHQRQVYTMVPDANGQRQSVRYKDAILSHIWPSSQAGGARAIGAALELPADCHVSERNFLILPTDVERLFDADALLLFPTRGPPRAATFRLGTVENAPTADRPTVAQYVGRTLYLPKEAENKVPYMRLLGWKAVSALRAEAEAAAAVEALPPDLEYHFPLLPPQRRLMPTNGS